MNQLAMELGLENYERTSAVSLVNEAFRLYREYKLVVPREFLPQVTTNYEVVEYMRVASSHNNYEESLFKYLEYNESIQKKRKYIEKLFKAINQLDAESKLIIIELYIKNNSNVFIAEKLAVEDTWYYAKKKTAIINFAYIINNWGLLPV